MIYLRKIPVIIFLCIIFFSENYAQLDEAAYNTTEVLIRYGENNDIKSAAKLIYDDAAAKRAAQPGSTRTTEQGNNTAAMWFVSKIHGFVRLSDRFEITGVVKDYPEPGDTKVSVDFISGQQRLETEFIYLSVDGQFMLKEIR